MDVPERIAGLTQSEVIEGLPVFCLERWQSLHETKARVNLAESGVYPLSLFELAEYGLSLEELLGTELGYGWTKGTPELREAISGLYGGSVGSENIVVTAGSAEANLLTALSLVTRGDVVLVDMPNYMQVVGLLRWIGARTIYLWREPPSWEFPLHKAVDLARKLKPRAIFVSDPNNPTGSYMTKNELSELAVEASALGTVLAFDEVYWGTERGEPKMSIAQVAVDDNFVSVSGLSKTYGLPGLRIGWAATGSGVLANRVWSIKDYTSIAPSVLSDKIATVVLSSNYIVSKLRERAKRIVEENKAAFTSFIHRDDLLDLYIGSAGAFAWVGIPWTTNTVDLSYQIYRRSGILLVPGECFGFGGYVRIGLGVRPDTFRSALRELMRILVELSNEVHQ